MRGVGTSEKGSGYVWIDYDLPTLDSNQLVVKPLFAGAEHIDASQASTGAYISQFPAFLGKNWSGIVERAGDGITDLKQGDQVAGLGYEQPAAAFREKLVVSRYHVAKLPSTYTLESASFLSHGFTTAFWTLFSPASLALSQTPDEGQTSAAILLWGASTNVGQLAIQQLRHFGYNKIIAVASARHFTVLQDMGASVVLDRSDSQIVAKIKEANGDRPVKAAAVFQADEEGWNNVLNTLDTTAALSWIIRAGPPEDKIPSTLRAVRTVAFEILKPESRALSNSIISEHLQEMLDAGKIRPQPFSAVEGKDMLDSVKSAATQLRNVGQGRLVIKLQ